jgi:hypothetical protein
MQWAAIQLAAQLAFLAGAAETLAAGRLDLSRADAAANSCLAVSGEVCIRVGDKRHTLGARVTVPHLIAWYSFDYAAPVDESGSGFHFTEAASAGPALLGSGSMSLNGTTIHAAPVQISDEFTLAFWVFLREDSVGAWRTIVGKGGSVDELTPTVLLQPTSRTLDARVTTEEGSAAVTSRGPIPLRKWTHVAVTNSGGVLRLFVNGLPEAERVLSSPVMPNNGLLRVGKDPWRAGSNMYLDDLRLYDVGLQSHEVAALAPATLTGISASNVRLGCLACERQAAVVSCEQTRLCSLLELYAHGFHVARAQGWAQASDDFWYHNQQDTSGAPQRVALCC